MIRSSGADAHPLVPVFTSRDRPWEGAIVHYHEWTSESSAVFFARDYHVLAVHISGLMSTSSRRDGQVCTAVVGAGTIVWYPLGTTAEWKWNAKVSVLVICIPPCMLNEVPDLAPFDLPTCEAMQCRVRGRDLFVERLATLLLDELRRPPAEIQRLISLTLSRALTFHIIHRFLRPKIFFEPVPHGLPARTLDRVIKYMDAHLHEHIDLQSLAVVANSSRFHFARRFKESTGVSSMIFLERRRIDRAQHLIRCGDVSLSQIANIVGFTDQSYFTRRFRLTVGMTPAVYAKLHGRANACEVADR